MRQRKTYRRFWSAETEAILNTTVNAPQTEPVARDKDTDTTDETASRARRLSVTLLCYLLLPVLLLTAFPEQIQPLSMLAAVFAGHKVLSL